MNWLQRFNTFCFLDSQSYQSGPDSLECIVGAGTQAAFRGNKGELAGLQGFIDSRNRTIFGHLNYDFIPLNKGTRQDGLVTGSFPPCFFFEPTVLIHITANSIAIEAGEPDMVMNEILSATESANGDISAPPIQSRLKKAEYLSIIRQLQQHILRGDCYEINFCQEFFATGAVIDPLALFQRLVTLSPNPFSALYRLEDNWLLCASPERFLKKAGTRIISQPIKGTAARIQGEPSADLQQKDQLAQSAKDRSENVMIVDLVRNDLARICLEGSVVVDELFGIYSFPQVYQMISTISGEVDQGKSFTEILAATFPMGSMTGAPKERVRQLIDQYENFTRGIFSGSVGYITPAGDFDLNVVIRSIIYNSTRQYLSFPAGSGITFYSDPELEWEECLLKAAAIRTVLG